jgi:hypothetical protein
LHYLHNNVLVIDQSEYIEDRPVPGPFPAFPMTKREKPWERGCTDHYFFHEVNHKTRHCRLVFTLFMQIYVFFKSFQP